MGDMAKELEGGVSFGRDAAFVPKGRKRELPRDRKSGGLQIADLVLVAVLLAAGAVLKLVVGMVFQGGVKPNFIIAAYCLAVLLIRPTSVRQGVVYGAIVGCMAGAVSQIPLLCGTPFVNFVSEMLGGMVVGAIAGLPAPERLDVRPAVGAFLGTFVSGSVFSAIVVLVKSMDPLAGFIQFAPIVVVTAIANTVLVQILIIPLSRALGRK